MSEEATTVGERSVTTGDDPVFSTISLAGHISMVWPNPTKLTTVVVREFLEIWVKTHNDYIDLKNAHAVCRGETHE